ncbi:MAG: M50 family metallopeptidase [Polyangiales bacterium]|nr:M50 family metallopeptidase [Myxococcales bacterium]
MTKPTRGNRWFLVASLAVPAILYAVPHGRLIAYPLVLLSTLVHELGHGVTAVLVGGHFHRFFLYADASGMAQVSVGGRLASAMVAAGGLVGPACAAAVGFWVSTNPKRSRIALGVVAVVLATIVVLYVRNLFGVMFVSACSFVAAVIAFRARPVVAELAVVFVSVQLALSVFSRGDYLFTPVARTDQGVSPSDVANMATALWLPYWFWGALCAAFSVTVLALGLRRFLRAR